MVAKKITLNIPIYEVQIQHDSGLTETFGTTEEHPFYVDGIGWQKASVLEAGMTLIDKQGKPTAKVISQQLKDITDTVYNFEVQDFHTYHIGEIGIWVHNADCCDLKKANAEIARKIQEDKGRLTHLNREQAINFIDNIRNTGKSVSANNGKKITISSDKKWILIEDPYNPMGGTLFENNRTTKQTNQYIQKFITENF